MVLIGRHDVTLLALALDVSLGGRAVLRYVGHGNRGDGICLVELALLFVAFGLEPMTNTLRNCTD
eukprot:6708397-Pyramimonas_sp.AAC.1